MQASARANSSSHADDLRMDDTAQRPTVGLNRSASSLPPSWRHRTGGAAGASDHFEFTLFDSEGRTT